MTKIIEFIIILSLVGYALILFNRFSKRAHLLCTMKRIGKIEGVSIQRLKNPLFSLRNVPSHPEFIVDIYGDTYLVRSYNGRGIGNVVHFASERFTVRFSRFKTATFRAPRGRFFTVSGFSVGGRVKTVEPIELPDTIGSKPFREVILFSPAPGEVSYVSPEKTSIKVAFTGDEVYGRKIFTASTFEIFVDREARRIKNEEKNPKTDIWSNLYAPK